MSNPLTLQFNGRVLEIATEAKISKAYDAMTDTDMLIGMDIITLCDFAITNKDGKTTFSFDIPSSRVTDYTN